MISRPTICEKGVSSFQGQPMLIVAVGQSMRTRRGRDPRRRRRPQALVTMLKKAITYMAAVGEGTVGVGRSPSFSNRGGTP